MQTTTITATAEPRSSPNHAEACMTPTDHDLHMYGGTAPLPPCPPVFPEQRPGMAARARQSVGTVKVGGSMRARMNVGAAPARSLARALCPPAGGSSSRVGGGAGSSRVEGAGSPVKLSRRRSESADAFESNPEVLTSSHSTSTPFAAVLVSASMGSIRFSRATSEWPMVATSALSSVAVAPT